MRELTHKVDFCVVGGGIAGLCAAVSAARQGLQVILVHDRPVLGGNASSEIRMWLCGATGANLRETGIVEELALENNYRNPGSNFSIWDSVLYQLARECGNLTVLMNCSVNSLSMDGTRIATVRGWQTTSETWHTVAAGWFADCSGDSILAPLSGAEFRLGREAAAEFGETLGQPAADRQTMGMSCLLQARETDSPKTFIPPRWAKKITSDEQLAERGHGFTGLNNFWWLELGGNRDSIHDTEELRHELLALAFGVWDHIKNQGEHGAENWELEWVGFLPGKRESRRYVGDHILCEADILAGGVFPDVVAYGGWPLDDHHPDGFYYAGPPNTIGKVPQPYGIPYRCLYSKNITNLFFAGRNISTTHVGLSSTRVMLTCGLLGQAVGTAAAIACRENCPPRALFPALIPELQQRLLAADCYLPGVPRVIAPLAAGAELLASEGDPEPLRSGFDRPVGEIDHGWRGQPGAWLEYRFAGRRNIKAVRMVFDSDLNRQGQGACANHWEKNILSNFPLRQPPRRPPATLVRSYRLEGRDDTGTWRTLYQEDHNYQRLVRIPLDCSLSAIRLIPLSTWGAEDCHLFAFEPEE